MSEPEKEIARLEDGTVDPTKVIISETVDDDGRLHLNLDPNQFMAYAEEQTRLGEELMKQILAEEPFASDPRLQTDE